MPISTPFRRGRRVAAAVLMCAFGSVSYSNGAITTYVDRTAWTTAASALGTVETEGFESLPTGSLPLGTNQLGAIQLKIAGVGTTTTSGASISGTTVISGTRELSINADTAFRTYDFTLPANYFAVGFSYAGANTGGLAALRAGGQQFVFGANSGAGFFGIISDTPLADFSMEDQTPGLPTEIFESDDYSFVLVPEPVGAAAAMLAGTALLRRRR